MGKSIMQALPKLLLVTCILILFGLFINVSYSFSCSDSAGICQDQYDYCRDAYSSCNQACNGNNNCLLNCYNYYDDSRPTGCQAQKNNCLQGCPWEMKSSAGTGGSIDPTYSSWTPLYKGESKTFTITPTPNSCYKIDDVADNGDSKGKSPTYTLYNYNNTTEYHDIRASFIEDVPVVPSNLTAAADSSTQINLSWNDNSTNETKFKIERKVGSGTFSQVAIVGANVKSYTDEGRASNTTYVYRVRAYYPGCNSAYSNLASATTLPTFAVTPSAGPNGSISPNTPQTVDYGATTSFTVTPNPNYHIASVTGCGGTLSGNVYTTGTITANCAVTATFALKSELIMPIINLLLD